MSSKTLSQIRQDLQVLGVGTCKGCIFGGYHSAHCFSDGSDGKEPACKVGFSRLTLGSGKSPGGEIGYSLQYSCLENSTDRGSWWAIVHGVTKSQTRLPRQQTREEGTLLPFHGSICGCPAEGAFPWGPCAVQVWCLEIGRAHV